MRLIRKIFEYVKDDLTYKDPRDFDLEYYDLCPDCDGMRIDDMSKCLTCNGKGVIKKD